MTDCDTSCEPMDVDLSTNSANNSIAERLLRSPRPVLTVHDNESVISSLRFPKETDGSEIKAETWHVKKYHIQRKTESSTKYSPLILLSFIVLPLAVIMYFVSDIRCSNDIDLKELKIKLSNRLYGQAEATQSLIEALGMEDRSKIIFFYGGTGVGKTYASNLIFGNVWNTSNVYHYTMPSFGTTFSTETMLGLNICDSSVVIVDDLKQNDFQVKKLIAEVINKSENLNKKITVILIYNCDNIAKDFVQKCEKSFYSDLLESFDDIKIYKKIIEFKPLNQEVLRLCIEDELRDKHVSDLHFNNLLNNFNVTLDGCKGVHKKIKFLNLFR